MLLITETEKITNVCNNPPPPQIIENDLENKAGGSLSFSLLWAIYFFPVSKINKQKKKNNKLKQRLDTWLRSYEHWLVF